MANGIKEYDDQDTKYNPAEALSAGEQAALDQIEAGLNDDGFGPDNNPSDSVGQREADAPNIARGTATGNTINYEPTKGKAATRSTKMTATKITGLLRGRIGIMGLITTFGLGGGLLTAFFGPASMLANLSQNLTINNDSSSTVLERRLYRVLGSALNSDSADLCMSSNKIRCKKGRIGNNTLRKMAKKGIVPLRDNTPMKLGKTGYAKQNPTDFSIEKNGKTINVPAKDLTGFLRQPDNRSLASKIYGRTGVINMRVRAWSGKIISSRFFSKLNIRRDGGLVSKSMKALASSERLKAAKEKLPKLSESVNDLSKKASSKVTKTVGKSGKAGAAYSVAVGACAAIKAPKYIAAGVAAVELISLVSLVSDVVLSPGAASQMQGIDDRLEFTGEDASAVGDLLTQTTPRESDGKKTSALDSAYLLTALGVSSTKLKMSKFVPGYSALNNPLLSASSEADKALEPGCNVIMNPVTMYTMMGIDAAATVALSATVVGGIVKVAAGIAISAAASIVAGHIVGAIAESAITALANTEAIDSATGEMLGDAIGIGATAFFASGSMSRLIPGLSGKGLVAFNNMKNEQEEIQKEMDIASLSPFDVSSRHTFLGSILYNMQMAMLSNGNYNNSLSSIAKNIASIPAIALSFGKTVKANSTVSSNLCGYAEDFDLSTGNPDTDPAINMAGMPCTGITPEMDSMTTDQAIDILSNEGWLDTEKEIPDGSSIDDLLSLGVIAKDTPMSDYIEDCGDPSTGDYLFNASSCTIVDSSGAASKAEINSSDKVKELNSRCETIGEGEESTDVCYRDVDTSEGQGEVSVDTPTTKTMSAIAVFLIDYQVSSILSGEDDGDEVAVSSQQASDSAVNLPDAVGNIVSPIPSGQNNIRMTAKYRKYPSGGEHWGVDLAGGGDNGWEFVSVCDGVVDSVKINPTYANVNAAKVSGSTNYVWVKCDNGVFMGYAHFYANRLRDYIKPGYRISAGTPIAPQGCQGNSRGTVVGIEGKPCGPHLHFQINPNSSSGYSASSTIDPVPYLERLGVSLPKPNY